jgi:TonB family protein
VNKTVKAVLAFVLFAVPQSHLAKQTRDEAIRDENIKVLDFEELRYPLPARLSHVEGVVVVKVELDDSGKVVNAIAISGAKDLISESLSNAKKWRFQPGSQKAAVIVYRFSIDRGLCHGVAPSDFIFHPPNFASITSCESVAEP